MGQEMQISQFHELWVFTDKKSGQEYCVTSINNNCTEKLQAIYDKRGNVYMSLEKIWEYPSNEFRCKVSGVPDTGWWDEDVYCLVREC